jgi:BolA family transcriptional regulator, general stress-responsive regulator
MQQQGQYYKGAFGNNLPVKKEVLIMSAEAYIRRQLAQIFAPDFLEVVNESHGHNVAPGSETHFKVVIVAEQFAGSRSVQRHRQVYAALEDALKGGVHALAIHTYTPQEWQAAAGAPESPACLGGSKR